MMNCTEIIIKYLQENGFDGLYNDDECGCDIRNLAICTSYMSQCRPGYKIFHPTKKHEYMICPNKNDKPWE